MLALSSPRPHHAHGRLRHRAQDARLDPCARADAGALWPCGRLAARRLRHRRAPGGPAPEGAGGDGGRTRPARRLCPRQRARRRPQGRGRRLPLRLGRARPRTRSWPPRWPRARRSSRTPRASPRSSTSPAACARWARRSRARAPARSPSRASTALGGATHQVVTDRIELGTYMLVPAICGGEVECLGGTHRPRRRFRREARRGRHLGHRDATRGPEGRPQERPRPRGGRDDRTLPRLPDRPAGTDDGASLHCRRHLPFWRRGSSRTASCMPPN